MKKTNYPEHQVPFFTHVLISDTGSDFIYLLCT